MCTGRSSNALGKSIAVQELIFRSKEAVYDNE